MPIENDKSGINSLDNAVKICIIIASLSVAYYFVYYLPHKENEAREQQKHETAYLQKTAEENQKKLDECLLLASLTYSQTFEGHCKKLGRAKDCLLPMQVAKAYEEGYNNDKEECFRKYKQ